MLAFAIAAALLVATALLAASALRLRAFTGFLLAAYVVAGAQVVVLTVALSLVHQVGASGYAVGQLVFLVVAAAAWNARGRPRQSLPRLRRASIFEHPAVALLGAAVAVSVGYQVFLVLATPPNSWDSLAYHLARAAEWYQRGAVEYYPTHSESVNAPQPNAEMLTLYTFAFVGRDTLAAAPQLFAQLASLVAVYGIATRLGFARAASAYAAFLTGTLSLVALQSVTTQNDLVAASFVLAALYFVLGRTGPDLALGGLALGLALGTKATALIAVPLILLAAALAHGRVTLVRATGFALLGFVLVGSYGYVLNVVHTGRVLGEPEALGALRQQDPTLTGSASTALRLGYNLVDLSGYPISDRATRPIELAGEVLFDLTGIPENPAEATVLELPIPSPFTFDVNTSADETRSTFGPLGALVLLPISLGFLIAALLSRAPPVVLVPALALPWFIVGVAVSARYNEFTGRYVLAGALMAMPLVAWLYSRRGLAVAVAVIGVLTLLVTHLDNGYKPSGIDERASVWSLSRAESQAISWPGMDDVIEGIELHVPADGRLGYVLRYNDWIYPFYGPELERRLVELPRTGLLAAAEREAVDAVIVSEQIPIRRDGWRAIRFTEASSAYPTLRSDWTLLLMTNPTQ